MRGIIVLLVDARGASARWDTPGAEPVVDLISATRSRLQRTSTKHANTAGVARAQRPRWRAYAIWWQGRNRHRRLPMADRAPVLDPRAARDRVVIPPQSIVTLGEAGVA